MPVASSIMLHSAKKETGESLYSAQELTLVDRQPDATGWRRSPSRGSVLNRAE
jgi:hypothetical protein